ncbi:hypothetical protein NQ318_013373 [Aromia moschata]|uniref:Uncharacterized protein n=1 Tax=Aromia moschata TaxID=1265417 RepID=A0AAV8XUB4_9CUCU|nr:hypothetical protein NQ318_013373 [Aromia moschata]
MATMLLKVMLSEGDEIPDMSEMADSGMNFAEEFNYDSVHDDSYKGRILDIVTVCLENDWLWNFK